MSTTVYCLQAAASMYYRLFAVADERRHLLPLGFRYWYDVTVQSDVDNELDCESLRIDFTA